MARETFERSLWSAICASSPLKILYRIACITETFFQIPLSDLPNCVLECVVGLRGVKVQRKNIALYDLVKDPDDI